MRNYIMNPTGMTIRTDKMGAGWYNAPRGTNRHDGVDFQCVPGQEIWSPITGLMYRTPIFVYAGKPWLGCEIQGEHMDLVLFYVSVPKSKEGKLVGMGEVIGVAQDISHEYGEDMIPHIHLEIRRMNPWVLMNNREEDDKSH